SPRRCSTTSSRTGARSPRTAKPRLRAWSASRAEPEGGGPMELTPLVPPGRQIIERYGPVGFCVSGTNYLGPVLVFPDQTLAWEGAAMTEAGLAPVVAHGGVELLLLGLGRRMAPVATAL